MPIIGASRRLSEVEVIKNGGYDPMADALALMRSFECVTQDDEPDISNDPAVPTVDKLDNELPQKPKDTISDYNKITNQGDTSMTPRRSKRTRFSLPSLSSSSVEKEGIVTQPEKTYHTRNKRKSSASSDMESQENSVTKESNVLPENGISNFNLDLNELAPFRRPVKKVRSPLDKPLPMDTFEKAGTKDRSALPRSTRSTTSVQSSNDTPPFDTAKRTRQHSLLDSKLKDGHDLLPPAKRLRSSSLSEKSDKDEDSLLILAASRRLRSNADEISQDNSYTRSQSDSSTSSNYSIDHSKYSYYAPKKRTKKKDKDSVSKRTDHVDRKAFEARFNELVEFKQKNGHTLVPKKYPTNQRLSYFVFRMRFYYHHRKRSLPKDLEDRLNSIGFSWVARRTEQQNKIEEKARAVVKNAHWDERIKELLLFKKKYGHTFVPKVFPENQPLSSWVFRQRQIRNNNKNGMSSKKKLTKEQIRQLDEIGFVWHPRASKEWRTLESIRIQSDKDDIWQNHYAELVAYKAENGHTRVPKVYPKNTPLGTWAYCQRRRFTMMLGGRDTHAFTISRWEQLRKIDFQFQKDQRIEDIEYVESIVKAKKGNTK